MAPGADWPILPGDGRFFATSVAALIGVFSIPVSLRDDN